MKKIIIVTLLLFVVSSCYSKNTKNEDKNQIKTIKEENLFLTWSNISKKEFQSNKIKKDNIKKELENIWEIKELKYKENTDFSKINIWEINKVNLEKEIYYDEYYKLKTFFLDFWYQKDHKKLERFLSIISDFSKAWKIKVFELHCNDIDNFNKKELDYLKNMDLDIFVLQDTCGFRKKEFSWVWYNKDKVIDFLKESNNIKELRIWTIDMDIYKKENWEIKFYSWN